MSLVRHFKMNDNAATTVVVDSAGVANGTFVDVDGANTNLHTVSGRISNALNFDGVNAYITTGYNPSSLASFSVAFWIYLNATPASDNVRIMDCQDAGPSGGFTFRFGTSALSSLNKISFAGRNGASQTWGIESADLTNGAWYHVVGTWTTNSAKFYIDATQQGGTDTVCAMSASSANLTIARRSPSSSNFFDGRLDDIRIYDEVLTQTQINDIYNAGSGTEGTSSPSASSSISSSVSSSVSPSTSVSSSPSSSISGSLSPSSSVSSSVSPSTSVSSSVSGSVSPSSSPSSGANDRNAYLWFDGDGDYVSIPDSAAYSVPTTGEITISAWIRPDVLNFPHDYNDGSGEGSYVHFLQKGDYPGAKHEWTFRMYSDDGTRPNRISFYVFSSNGGLGVGSFFQDTVTAGQWIHVTGKIDATKTYIYKNGSLRDSDIYNATITPANTTAPIGVGAPGISDASERFFKGAIDDVIIWNRALSDVEVSDVYNGTPSTSGMVGRWSFDDGTGNTAVDDISANNGTLNPGNGQPAWAPPSPSISPSHSLSASVSSSPSSSVSPSTSVSSSPSRSVSPSTSISSSPSRSVSASPSSSPSSPVTVSDDFNSYTDGQVITDYTTYSFASFPNAGTSGGGNPSSFWETDTGWLYSSYDSVSGRWGYSGRPIDWADKYFFRINTRASALNADVSFKYKSADFGVDGFAVEGGDATDVWLRYQTQYWLYVVQFDRQNNGIVVKRKVPANTAAQYGGTDAHISNKGVYYTLKTDALQPVHGAGLLFISWSGLTSVLGATGDASKPNYPNLAHDGTLTGGTTYDFRTTITTYDGGGAFNWVRIQLYRAGVLVGSWTDKNDCVAPTGGRTFQQDWDAGYYSAVTGNQAAWGYPIYTTGKSGLRADNLKVWIDNFVLSDSAVGSSSVSSSISSSVSPSTSVSSSTSSSVSSSVSPSSSPSTSPSSSLSNSPSRSVSSSVSPSTSISSSPSRSVSSSSSSSPSNSPSSSVSPSTSVSNSPSRSVSSSVSSSPSVPFSPSSSVSRSVSSSVSPSTSVSSSLSGSPSSSPSPSPSPASGIFIYISD